jgi:hypothetical protein
VPWENESVTTHIQDESHNFFFSFIPKELLYIKNNYSKCEMELTAALGVICMSNGAEGLT